jgi:hypothetical protein
VQKIEDWPECKSVTKIRSFLGTCGVLRIFVKDYAKIVRQLVDLMRKDIEWEFAEEQREAMARIKDAIVKSPALRPIDYVCGRKVILAVDSLYIVVGFMLLQLGVDEKRYPAQFGSIPWNPRESRYSQAKLELYGLFCALRAYRLWLVGLPKFTVETDAKYIKGMLNHPDIQPNAAINRWIAGILLFDFDLVHVPGDKHTVANGLSQRPPSPDDPEQDDDYEDWIDQAYGFMIEVLNWCRDCPSIYSSVSGRMVKAPAKILSPDKYVYSLETGDGPIPRHAVAAKHDEALLAVEEFLRDPMKRMDLPKKEKKCMIRKAAGYFIMDEKLEEKEGWPTPDRPADEEATRRNLAGTR